MAGQMVTEAAAAESVSDTRPASVLLPSLSVCPPACLTRKFRINKIKSLAVAFAATEKPPMTHDVGKTQHVVVMCV